MHAARQTQHKKTTNSAKLSEDRSDPNQGRRENVPTRLLWLFVSIDPEILRSILTLESFILGDLTLEDLTFGRDLSLSCDLSKFHLGGNLWEIWHLEYLTLRRLDRKET